VNLPKGLIALLHQPSIRFLTTLMPDGSPQITQTWVDTDGEHVVINTVQGFQKVKNVERDPRVAVAVADPSGPSRYYAIRGRVVNVPPRAARNTSRPSPSATWALLTRGTEAAARFGSSSPSARTRSMGWGR
jgi:PPOX class probable F420-dependent enzyme